MEGKKNYLERYRIRQIICVILGICIALAATLILTASRMKQVDAKVARTQESLAKEVFRFHVLANSDSDEDQQLKMEVKGLVISYVNENLGGNATKEKTAGWLMEHKDGIEEMARTYILSQGKDYPVKLELARDYFPTKAYGDMVFPCGTYDAARITIGSGRGHNWCCVLYPPLCYTDSMNAVVPERSKETLKSLIPDEDYEALLPEKERTDHRSGKPRVQVRFRLAELLGLGREAGDK